jgi:hypothetical protein
MPGRRCAAPGYARDCCALPWRMSAVFVSVQRPGKIQQRYRAACKTMGVRGGDHLAVKTKASGLQRYDAEF